MQFRVEGEESATALRVQYVARFPSGSEESLDYPVDIIHTPCNFGGERPWFVCPMSRHQGCSGRVRILYLPPGETRFGCRICHRLTYPSCKLSRNSLYREIVQPMQVLDRLPEALVEAQDETQFNRAVRRAVEARRRLDEAMQKLKGVVGV